MDITSFLKQLNESESTVDFYNLMAVIEHNYNFKPVEFKNGTLINKAGQNDGSCKLFSFAQMHQLSEAQTLACFGAYYRDDVLKQPNENNHQNIRNFMRTGWEGIQFEHSALSEK